MADPGEEVVIRACPSAQRGAAAFGLLGLVFVVGGFTMGPSGAVIGVALGLVLIVGGVRGVRARLTVRDGRMLVSNMWSIRWFDADAVAAITIQKKAASFWTWGLDGNVPPLRQKELVILTFGDGSQLAPEALRRSSGDPDVDLVVTKLGDAFGMLRRGPADA